jgi:hypothetical protein
MHDFLRLMVWVASLCCEQFHRHNSTLHKLDLADNQISNAGAVALCDGLRCGGLHSCLALFRSVLRWLLQMLDNALAIMLLWGWRLTLSFGVGSDEWRITRLVLVGWRITRALDQLCGRFLMKLALFHRHNSALQILELSRNQIGDAGAAAVEEVLRCVDLHSCLIFSQCGAQACYLARCFGR